jgi:hypothetical protein
MRHARPCVAALVAALFVVTGCSGGGGATSASGGAASSRPAASAAQASGAPAAPAGATPAAASPTAASAQPATGGGTLPADPCKLVTAADVGSVYGGTVKALGLGDNGACAFELTGKAKAGKPAAAGEFAVSFGDTFTSYDTATKLFGKGVTKVEGLGTEAYSVGGFIHAKVGSGDLVVGGVWVGDYVRALLATEDAEIAKLLLGRL